MRERSAKRLLAEFLKGKKITDLSIKVDTVEGPPKDGYRTKLPTGTFFVALTIKGIK